MVKWTPWKYQLTALSHILSNPKSGLFLDPGLGKTSISLSAIRILLESGNSKGILIIAPLRVTYSVWPQEIEKWENFKNLTHTILHGDNKDSLWTDKKDIYLINPEGLKWLHTELLKGLKAGKKLPFDSLWIDESTKFKSYDSARFGYISDMLPLFKRRHIMTGTPAPKNLLDLWSQMFILDDGAALGNNYHKFKNKYFYTEDWNKYNWKLKDFADKEIQKAMSHLVLEMSSKDYLDMPKLIINDIPVILPAKAMSLYKEMEKEFFISLDNMESSAEAEAQSSAKCHQISNGRVYEDIPKDLNEDEIRKFKKTRKTLDVHTAKIEALKDLIDELNGKPLLISYYFKHDLESLKSTFKDIKVIGSGTTASETNQLVSDWNNGKLLLLAAHPGAMAHGLNLQKGGNDICWFSQTWNLEDYLQYNARIYRQGVTGDSVRIHRLIGKDTIDEAMVMRLKSRDEDQLDLRAAIKQYRKNIVQSSSL
jgi:hypothetical protein